MVSSLRRFTPYYGLLKPHRVAFFGAILCALIYGVASGFAFPTVVKNNIPIIFGNDDGKADSVLLITILTLPLAILVRAVAGFFNTYLIAYCGVKVLEQIRNRLFGKIQDLHLAYFQDTNKGDLLSRLMVDCTLVRRCIVEVSNNLIKEPFVFLSAFCYLVYLSIKNDDNLFLLFCLAAIPICVLPIRYVGKRLARKAQQLQKETGNVTEVATENLGATREIRAFSLEGYEKEKFGRSVAKTLGYQLKVVKYEKSLSPIIEVITGFAITIAIYAAAISNKEYDVGEVVSLFVALHMCYDPIKRLGAINSQLKKGIASLDRDRRSAAHAHFRGRETGSTSPHRSG